ncbi:hypothetical protein ACFQT0_30545 [Hymenobacter humi]|uniref:Uncharacterized protein n=1 Tax=Hymenobacter humi TaxID=1411620 RepID=A0ABW2UFR9_9BACT
MKAHTLAEAFVRGQWHGRVRNYFMATVNRGNGPDYYANGLGAGARFETAPLHGFQLGAGGFSGRTWPPTTWPRPSPPREP